MNNCVKRIIVLLLVVVTLFALFSCKEKENGDTGNKPNTNIGDSSTPNLDDAVWTTGSTVTVYSDTKAYVELVDSKFFESFSSGTGATVTWKSESYATTANSILIGNIDCEVSKEAYKRLEYEMEKSSNLDNHSYWLIYASGTSVALAYSSDYAMLEVIDRFVESYGNTKTFSPKQGILMSESFSDFDYVANAREERVNGALDDLVTYLGSDTVEELKNLYSIYSYKDYIWLADLWDPETGGFYYSNSARNSIGYLPDLESTGQALNYLENSGMINRSNLFSALPDEMKDKMASFVINMQSSTDGFFYHPQWGTVGSSRRGRDLDWATGILKDLHVVPLYDTPDGVLSGSLGPAGAVSPTSSYLSSKFVSNCAVAVSKVVAVSSSNLPNYLQTVNNFKTYIAELNIPYASYGGGNTLAAQHTQIEAADRALWLKQNPSAKESDYSPQKPAKDGFIEYLINYFNSIQDSNTGLFEALDSKNDAYYRVDGLMKISTVYSYFGHNMPNVEAAFESCIKVILIPDGHVHVCSVYNPWITMKVLLGMAGNDSSVDAKALRQRALDVSAQLVKNTLNKLTVFMMDNGSFTYYTNQPCNVSQGAKVACAVEREATVNALGLCSASITTNISAVLGYRDIDLFSSDDFTLFMNYLVSLGKIVKYSPPPREPITFDEYETEAEDTKSGVTAAPDYYVSCVVNDKDVENGKYKWFGSSVVPNPIPGASKTDLVLKTNVYTRPGEAKNKADVMSSTIFSLTEEEIGATCYIFESDILIKDAYTDVIAQMAYTSKHSDYVFGVSFIGYEDENGNKFVRLYDRFPGKDGVINYNLVDEIPMGDWFNLRIELYRLPYNTSTGGIGYDIKAQIFINDEYVCESDAGYIVSGEEDYSTTNIDQFRYNHYRYWESETYFNNCNLYAVSKEYVAIEPAVPVRPDGTLTFDDGKNEKVDIELNSENSSAGIIKVKDKEGYVLDKAISVYSSKGAKDILSILNSDTTIGYDAISFSADIRIKYASGTDQKINILFGAKDSEHYAYKLTLVYSSSTGKFALYDESNLGDGKSVTVNLKNDQWFSIKVDYYKLNNTEILSLIYINDILIYVSDNYADSNYNAIPVSSGYTTSDKIYLSNGINRLAIELDESFGGNISIDNLRFEKEAKTRPTVDESSYTSRYHSDSDYEDSKDENYEYIDFETSELKNNITSIDGIFRDMTEGGGSAVIAKVEDKNGILTNALVINGVQGDIVSMVTGNVAEANRLVFIANIKPEFMGASNEQIELVLGSTGSNSLAAYRLVLSFDASDETICLSDFSDSGNVGSKVNLGVRNGEWLSVRVEYYKVSSNEILVLTYVNGNLVYVSDNVATDKNRFGTAWSVNGAYTTHDGGTIAKGLNALKIAFGDSNSVRITVDDVVVCKESGESPVINESDYTSRFHQNSTGGGGTTTTPEVGEDVSGNLSDNTWH